MREKIGDQTRLAIAKKVIEQLIEITPEKSILGLRVYGHRYLTTQPELASIDSELLVPLAPLDKDKFLDQLRSIREKGGTPLAYSIEAAVRDLKGIERPRVILITDGVESFRGKPVVAAKKLWESSKKMDFIVVGFGIGTMTDEESLKKVAEAGAGVYYSAKDADSLVQSIGEALRPTLPYVLIDEQGRTALKGRFGDRHRILEGRYTCVVTVNGKERRIPVRIFPDKEFHQALPKG
jgi:Ca-activated chloride channel family protein